MAGGSKASEFRDDLYGILGLEAAASEKEVKRAYKTKSLLHHPDRGGDVQKFHELQHARDLLLDPKTKEKYDKQLSHDLLAKRKQRERDAALDSKRRQMRDELLRKEQSHELKHKQQARSQSDLSKLRDKGLAAQQALEARLARDAKRRRDDAAAQAQATGSGSKSQRTVTIKWDRKQFSHSDETLSRVFRTYGDLLTIKLKAASAKLVFATAAAAATAVRVEGHKPNWRDVSIQGHIVEADEHATTTTTATTSRRARRQSIDGVELPRGPIGLRQHLEFERRVLHLLKETATLQQSQAQQQQQTVIPVE